jgi:hypothetical protein
MLIFIAIQEKESDGEEKEEEEEEEAILIFKVPRSQAHLVLRISKYIFKQKLNRIFFFFFHSRIYKEDITITVILHTLKRMFGMMHL